MSTLSTRAIAASQTSVGGGLKFKLKARITREHFKIENNVEYIFTIEAPMWLSQDNAQEVKRVRAPKLDEQGKPIATITRKKQPPVLMDVIVHDDTGDHHGRIIVNAVLEEELIRAYDNDGYVGKTFRVIKNPILGKDYSSFDIQEVEIEDEAEDEAEAVTTAMEKPSKKSK